MKRWSSVNVPADYRLSACGEGHPDCPLSYSFGGDVSTAGMGRRETTRRNGDTETRRYSAAGSSPATSAGQAGRKQLSTEDRGRRSEVRDQSQRAVLGEW
jgi:hypothetical protein